MLEKYVLSTEDRMVIGVKYHLQQKIVTIGGHVKFMRIMEHFLTTYFHTETPKPVFPQRNKVRLSFAMERKNFLEALKEIEAQAITITPVTSLERVMR